MQQDVPTLRLKQFADPDFPLAALNAGIGAEFPRHCHDFFELVYVRHGGGLHIIDDRPYPMLRGDVYLMHPADIHGYDQAEQGSSIVNVLFQAAVVDANDWADLTGLQGLQPFFLTNRRQAAHKLALAPGDAYAVERRCDRLIAECHDRAPGWQHSARATLVDLLVLLARANASYGRISSDAEPAAGPVAAAMRMIARYWDQPLSVTELATQLGYSANWFGERFHRETGLTIQGYQAKLRIDHARIMLEESHDSITDIALECGFDDPSYFGRVFKRHTGMTPRAYRKLTTS